MSVIVPAFRAARFLRPCLQALAAQDLECPFEVLIVENASPDESYAVAEAFARTDSRFRVVREPRPGSYAARNRGVEETRGGILLFTDSDCLPTPSWARYLVESLEDEGVLLAGGEIEGEPDQPGLLARHAREAGILSAKGALEHRRGPFAQTANLGVRRADLESVDGFDAGLFSGGDADFCWRLAERHPERRLLFVPKAVVHHRHRDSLSGLWRQFFRYGQSDVVQVRRHGVQWSRWPLALGADALRWILWPLLALFGLPRLISRGDPLGVLNPPLRAFRSLARRCGQLSARLRPRALRRE